MKKIFVVYFIALASLLNAANNINGVTGYVVMPTGDGLKAQEYTLGLNAYTKTKYINSHWKYLAALGTPDGMEVSLIGRSEREGVFVNLKWFGALQNSEDPLMVGMGFENLSSLGTFGDHPDLYMVATKKFMNGNSFSIGFTGRYISKEVKVSAMTGCEFYFNNNLSLVADIVSYDDNRYNTNAGFRYYTNNNMHFNLLVINASRNNIDPEVCPTITTLGLTFNNFM